MPGSIGVAVSPLNRTTAKQWKSRVERAQRLLKVAEKYREPREIAWRHSERQYMGSQPIQEYLNPNKVPTLGSKNVDQLSVNISHSIVSTVVPYHSGRPPLFFVQPFSGNASQTGAIAWAALINRWARSPESRLTAAGTLATFDSSIYGDGWSKLVHKEVTIPKYGENNVVTGAAKLWEVYVERLSPFDIWLDPSVDSKYDASFIIQRVLLPRDEIAADDRYWLPDGKDALPKYNPNTGTTLSGDSAKDEASAAVADAFDIIEVFEMWDIRNKTMITFVPDLEWPLRVVEHITCPLVPLENTRIPGSPYTQGDLEQIADLQKLLDRSASVVAESSGRAVSKLLVKKNIFDDVAKRAFESNVQREVVELDIDEDIDGPLSSQLSEYTPQPAPFDHMAQISAMRDYINEITGVTEMQRGRAPSVRHTATVAEMMEHATNVRIAYKLRKVERFYELTGQLYLDRALAVYPLSDEDEVGMWIPAEHAQRIVAAASEEGLLDEFNFSDNEAGVIDIKDVGASLLSIEKPMFRGRYEVTVHENSTELQNPILVANKYSNILKTIVELTMGGALDHPNVRRAAEEYLRKEGIQQPGEFLDITAQQVQVPGTPPPPTSQPSLPLPPAPPMPQGIDMLAQQDMTDTMGAGLQEMLG